MADAYRPIIDSVMGEKNHSMHSPLKSQIETMLKSQEMKIFEDDEYKINEFNSKIGESAESLCTPCTIEVAELSKRNNEEDTATVDLTEEPEEEILENLMQASKSLSEISIKNQLEFDIEQETFWIENNYNDAKKNYFGLIAAEQVEKNSSVSDNMSTNPKMRNSSRDFVADNSHETHNNIKILHINSSAEYHLNSSKSSNVQKDDVLNEESDFLLRISSLHDNNIHKKRGVTTSRIIPNASLPDEPLTKRSKEIKSKILCDKAIQTENLMKSNFSTSERVLNSKETEQNLGIIHPNYEGITTNVMSRKRRIHSIANNIYTTSCYLDEIRKALVSGTTSETIIPPPPKLSGYDDQFDFPDRNRFSKLPITFESVVGLKREDTRGSLSKARENSSSSTEKGKKNHRKISAASLKPLSVKSRIKNKVEISLPNRFQQKQTIKDMLLGGNKENNLIKTNQKHPISNITSLQSDISSGMDDSSDNGSLFNYNPLRYARENRK